jgi:hypothetical protein
LPFSHKRLAVPTDDEKTPSSRSSLTGRDFAEFLAVGFLRVGFSMITMSLSASADSDGLPLSGAGGDRRPPATTDDDDVDGMSRDVALFWAARAANRRSVCEEPVYSVPL